MSNEFISRRNKVSKAIFFVTVRHKENKNCMEYMNLSLFWLIDF